MQIFLFFSSFLTILLLKSLCIFFSLSSKCSLDNQCIDLYYDDDYEDDDGDEEYDDDDDEDDDENMKFFKISFFSIF